MFGVDLEELATAEVLSAASEFGRIENRAAVRVLEAALVYADRHAVVLGEPRPGYEQVHVYGGDGCPGVAEFAPIEFGAVLRMSSGAAAALIGEALALRHRLPRIWAAVLAGDAVPWRARKIAHACLSLSQQAAAIVDRRVVGIVDTVTPGALDKIVKAAIWEADPEAAKAQAEAAARTRGVFVAPSDDHGTKRIWVRAAAGDVIRFDATIDDLARALKILGDPDDLNHRRAKAIGWIADPAAAHQLLEAARYLARTKPASTEPGPTQSADPQPTASQPTRTPQPQAQQAPVAPDAAGGAGGVDAFTRAALADSLAVRLAAIKQEAHRNGLGAGSGRRSRHTLYVHLTDRTLATGNGVLRVEELGPLLAGQLNELLGHDQIVVKPVIDLQDQVSVHSYEIPDRIRERIRLQHPVDMFPYSGAEATTRMDQDHIAPYERAGPPRQTTTDNLIPLGRLHHRAKTFGGWRSRRLPTGAIAWTSPHGHRFVVDHTGTHQVPTAPLTQHPE
ncbi:DUF222 domain-containing protein [Kribbella speibonae]|uniref:DUF222 domain-containing protein n=1 Tax=Kribbella speibonae TaxID=1572660 RepID=A0ABY2A2H6_9ACTN|nr:DUF222 domain-containing protein [Kribbella speibonae]TCC20907.1 DUF222 domain-containing protein [Kribbella speibonae]